jgi:hypothetical protein
MRGFIKQPADLIAMGQEIDSPCAQCLRVMEAQYLDIADDQARALNHGSKFGQCRRVTPRKDVAPHPGIGFGWTIPAPDRVEQHHAIVREQVAAFAEERIVMARANVFEHSDRDDAIEFLRHRTIILDAKLARQPFGGRALPRDPHLLIGEVDADDGNLGIPCEIEIESPPSAAYVENPQPRLEEQFGSDVAFLGELRLVE